MATRRAFVHAAAATLAGACLHPFTAHSFVGVPAQAIGLFFGSGDLPSLRKRFTEEDLFAPVRDRLLAIDRSASRDFLRNTIRYNDHLYDIAIAANTAFQMAFIHTMAGDEDALDLAVEATRTLMKFPKWDYFLEAGTDVIGLQRAPGTTLAVACVIDWLAEEIDEAERREWARTMGERGIEPSFRSTYGMRYPERVVGWSFDPESTYLEHRPGDRFDLSNWPVILDDTNLKAIPAAALTVGALAYRHVLGEDDNTRRWLEQALFSLRSFRELFAPDGSYPEGVSYANYTAQHLVMAADALHRAGDEDLFDEINWIGFGEYLREMTLPTTTDPAAIINFSDAGGGATSAVPFWTAGRAFDGRSQWFGRTHAREHDEWSIIWYDASVDPALPSGEPHLWKSDLEWMVARTGYQPDDLVVAMRSGGPANHEHADRNSIIVKAYGEILVADPYRPPYSNSDPAWMMRTTAGHSALLIDGQGHQYHKGEEGTNSSDAAAHVVRSGERAGFMFWASDATPAYQLVMPDVSSVTRTVIVLHDVPAVIVADKVVKHSEPSIIEARFFGMNRDEAGRIETNSDHFRTIRPGAYLVGLPASSAGVAISHDLLPIPEETADLHPFAAASTRESAVDPFLVTVLLPVLTGASPPEIDIAQEGAETRIGLTSGDRTASCILFDAGSLPEFDVTV